VPRPKTPSSSANPRSGPILFSFHPISFFQLAASKYSIALSYTTLPLQHLFIHSTLNMATLNLPKEPLFTVITLPVPAFSDIAKPSNDVRFWSGADKISGVMMDIELMYTD